MSNRKPDLEAVSETKRFIVPNVEDRYVTKAMDCFLNTDETKVRFGPYFIDGKQLLYRTVAMSHHGSELLENIVAQKIDQGGSEFLVGNSSMLKHLGRRVSFGRERSNNQIAEIQIRLGDLIPMMPFSVFEEASLNMEALRIIERGPEETITRIRNTERTVNGKKAKLKKAEFLRKSDLHYGDKYEVWIEETVHYTGASLFRVGKKHFLFDLDRREIEQKIFNPFLVELPGSPKTIADAYDSLTPDAVKEADRNGVEVKRQGEWFFHQGPGCSSKTVFNYRDTGNRGTTSR